MPHERSAHRVVGTARFDDPRSRVHAALGIKWQVVKKRNKRSFFAVQSIEVTDIVAGAQIHFPDPRHKYADVKESIVLRD
jgi:hypothetical protein